MTAKETTMTLSNIELKSLSNLNLHFNWYTETSNLNILYYEAFKSNDRFDELLFERVQFAFLDYIKNKFSKKIHICYIFLAIEYNGRKVEDHYKVWKQMGRKWNIKGMNPLEEKKIKTPKHEYYIGLSSFDELELKTAFTIQKQYYNNCFVLIDFSNNQDIPDVELLASYFLRKNSTEGFKTLFNEACNNGFLVVRIGDGGEDWEIAFIFSKNLLT